MDRRIFLNLSAIALMLVGGSTLIAADGELRILLTGTGGKGTAKYKVKKNAREFQVEAEKLKVAAGTVLAVMVDGNLAGSMTVSATKAARLNLSTQLKQQVPVIATGSTVTVVGPDGAILLSGKF